MRVVVLGTSGMLGAMVGRTLARERGLEVVGTERDAGTSPAELAAVRPLDVESADDASLDAVLDGAAWAINAIGVVKVHIRDDVAAEVERAIRVNALFPHRLAAAAARTGTRVIQIATDCVYSGERGAYVEADEHDPRDVYGRTKSLGEVRADHVTHLRCSVVGPEQRTHRSLLDWFLRQPRHATVSGYTNHRWNGVTTRTFARLCLGLMRHDPARPAIAHVVPADAVTKHDLLQIFARAYGRGDITITPGATPTPVDRTVATSHPDVNVALWRAAGYDVPPTIEAMVQELAGA